MTAGGRELQGGGRLPKIRKFSQEFWSLVVISIKNPYSDYSDHTRCSQWNV